MEEKKKGKYYRKKRKNKPKPPKPHTIEQLRELIIYDPETGQFGWAKPRKGVKPGASFGSIDDYGYRLVRVDGYPYRLQHLAWALVHGYWADGLDYVDWDKANNKLSNIVESDAYASQHKRNTRRRWARVGTDDAHDAALKEDKKREEAMNTFS